MNDNEKVEVLSNNRNNNTINSNNQVAVVTNNEVHQEVETITVDENGQVQPISLDYNEYRNSLNKIYQLSTSNNSLILNFVKLNAILPYSSFISSSSFFTNISILLASSSITSA